MKAYITSERNGKEFTTVLEMEDASDIIEVLPEVISNIVDEYQYHLKKVVIE